MSLPPDVSRSASAAEPAAQPAPTSRRRWLYGAVAGAAALGGAGLAWWRFQPHAMQDGAEAALWGMEFDTPTGGAPLAMKALQGRPVLLNFWATWCPPCVEEMPLLSRFYTQTKDNGWQMLGLAIDQVDLVQRFLARTPVSYPIAMAGPTGVEWTKKLGNAAGGLPFTVVFDRQGAIQHRKLGQLKPEDLAAWLR